MVGKINWKEYSTTKPVFVVNMTQFCFITILETKTETAREDKPQTQPDASRLTKIIFHVRKKWFTL